ncbi:MAG: PD-(D/E)XK nuclease family protein [Candidatus Sungbacteria bacterium]|uniref:PD-(D/E)XK nuclease family protein n=1 Tax=Candidatus Sungiibacteriota bacterium TaxID=2750080 RepID=A0A932YWF9_9BACT|nr:PD-(D/E)XK nuclease family protein [Candidatus Sungbacteria bacterium]
MRTSYSALETYKLCPQKYKFQEIDRIPAKKSNAALFGTHLHSCLKFMFSHDPLFPTLDEVLNYFRENWPSPEKMEVTPEEKELYFAAGEKMLRNFYAKNSPWNFSVVDVESRFEILIEDPRKREAHVLAGRIDRIDKNEDGFEVIDYKTSRRMPSQDAVDRDLQMSIYALGLEKRWPHVKPENITLSLYFLKHGEKLSTRRTPEATQATAEEVLKTVSEIQEKLASGERFEPVPGPYCDWCPYKPICPAWRHLYRNQESGIKNQEEIDSALKEYFGLLKEKERHEARLNELKAKIRGYMEAEGFDRVFSEEGYISRSPQKRFAYDFEKIRAILEPLGKWSAILTADEKKLKLVLQSLGPEVRVQIEDAKVMTREFTVLTASTKKIPKPSQVHPVIKGEEKNA